MTPLMRTQLVLVILALALSARALAATITTPIQMVADGVAYASERYAKANNGATPRDWSQLKQYVNMAVLDSQVGGSAEQRITLVTNAALSDPKREVIVAVTTNPISEDRRDRLGRYTIWRRNGQYQTVWQSEEAAKKQLASQGAVLPQGEVYRQPDVRPEIAIHDAAEPMEGRPSVQAAPRPQQPTPTASVPATPVPSAPPAASPQPATPIAQTPARVVERKLPLWPWVVGIAALLVIVAFALKRRA